MAADENDGKKEVNIESVATNSSQETSDGNVVNTQSSMSSVVEIKRFKETSV